MITIKLEHEEDSNIGILWLVHQDEKKLQIAKVTRNELNQYVSHMEWSELSMVFAPWLRSRSMDLGVVKEWVDVESVGRHFLAYLSDLAVLLQWSRE